MEVCGTHTMAIGRYGIRSLLPDNIHLISGPGCPVCVTVPGYIDAAIALADAGKTIVTFGDLIRVPGSKETLADCRARGGTVEVCYSPMASANLAAQNPDREFVFLAVGFETTIVPAVGLLRHVRRLGIGNLSLLVAFKLVPPALEALLADPDVGVGAFLCPAHVSAIIGAEAYEPVAQTHRVPCVIAGFEPLDILLGLNGILEQIAKGESRVDNQYSRVVRAEGNRQAQELMREYLLPGEAVWRGIGAMPDSGLILRDAYADFDAERRHGFAIQPGAHDPRCLCGDVIRGKCSPQECKMFGKACTPERPVGPCMVSAEGTCAAYFKYEIHA